MNIRNVESEITGDGLVVKEVVQTKDGILLSVEGHPYPVKGFPKIQEVTRANEIKAAMKKPWSLKKIPYYPATFGIFAKEVQKLVSHLTNPHLAYLIAYVVEYDQAYRFRLQDLLSELTHLSTWEILRLSKLNYEREVDKNTHKKLRYIFWLAAVHAFIFKKKWLKAQKEITFSNLQFDAGDKYWASMKTDYRYCGRV